MKVAYAKYQEHVSALRMAFPQASRCAIRDALRLLRADNRANGGA